MKNQRTKEDSFQRDQHPEVGISLRPSSQKLGSEKTSDMVTGVQEKISYCSPQTSLGREMEARSTS